jgi:hypothetical protein
MIVSESKLLEQARRIQVELEPHPLEKNVKIRVENYDDKLGWYTAGSLTLPLHQLPLLEQAIEQMRALEASEDGDKIIPFPL